MYRKTNCLLLLPALLLSVCVVLVPGILTVFTSFTDWNGVQNIFQATFIGLDNYRELFKDEIFWMALFNNIKWMLLFLIIPVSLGLLSSGLLLYCKKGRSIYQVSYLVPYVMAPIVNAMLWLNIIYSPVAGVIGFLKKQGVAISSPLSSMNTALYGVAGVALWNYWGFLSVVYVSSLRQTPQDQIEAAKVEGCNGWQLFRYVYFETLKPTFKLMLVMVMIQAFLVFDYIKILTDGGPAHATEMLSTYAYTFAFSTYQVGRAAAVSLFMSMLGLIFSGVYTWMSRHEND